MNKFNTQIHVEENNEYQPTAADLAEFNDWCAERELDEFDMQVALAEAEAEAEAEADWEEVESDDGHRELYTEEEAEEFDGQPDEYTEWQDFMGGDEYYDHSESMGEW